MLRPRARRWVLVAVVAVALLELAEASLAQTRRPPWLGVRAEARDDRWVVAWVLPDGRAWDAGVRPGDLLLAVDDRAAPSADQPLQLDGAHSLEVQSPAGRRLRASGDFAPTVSARRLLPFSVLAAAYAALGGAVFILASDLLAASAFLAFAAAAATMLLAAIATPHGAAWALAALHVGLVTFGATAVLLFLVFPVNRLRSRPGRLAALVCLGTHAVLLLFYAWTTTFAPAAYEAWRRLAFLLLVIDFFSASGFALRAARVGSPLGVQARRALVLVALGTAAGLTPPALLSLLPGLLGMEPLVPAHVAALSLVLVPASLSAAVVSRQFLGIRRLARRGLVALVVWVGLLAVYAVALKTLAPLLLGSLALAPAPGDGMILFIALVAGTFPLLQRALRRRLERALFHDVYDYADTLRQLGSEIVGLRGASAIATHVLARLGATLDLAWAAIELSGAAPSPGRYLWGDPPTGKRDPQPGLPLARDARESAEPAHQAPARSVPLVSEAGTIGQLIAGPKRRDIELLPEDHALLETLAPLVATALHNALLLQDLETQVAALAERERELAALSARLMRVQEEERRRLALDIHDDPLQRAILLVRQMSEEPPSPYVERRRRAVEEIIVSLKAICTELWPPALDHFGLAAGLEWLVNDVRARSDITVTFDVSTPTGEPFGRLPLDLEVALYRVAQEALNNCLKHARATHVRVALVQDESGVEIRVMDNGVGLPELPNRLDEAMPRLGILGMRERLKPWRGEVALEQCPEGGLCVTALVPQGGGHARPT